MVYAPVGRQIQRADVSDHRRDGEGVVVQSAQRHGNSDRQVSQYRRARIHAADAGEMLDWVLVLDDAAKEYRGARHAFAAVISRAPWRRMQ